MCYLHLITDAYSHKIIGWVLADTLRAAITKEALEQAISQAGVFYPIRSSITLTVESNTVVTNTSRLYGKTISASV